MPTDYKLILNKCDIAKAEFTLNTDDDGPYYVTDDGQCFTTRENATLHARDLETDGIHIVYKWVDAARTSINAAGSSGAIDTVVNATDVPTDPVLLYIAQRKKDLILIAACITKYDVLLIKGCTGNSDADVQAAAVAKIAGL